MRELARLAGIAPSHVQRLEAGSVDALAPETVAKLAEALGASRVEVLKAAGYLADD